MKAIEVLCRIVPQVCHRSVSGLRQIEPSRGEEGLHVRFRGFLNQVCLDCVRGEWNPRVLVKEIRLVRRYNPSTTVLFRMERCSPLPHIVEAEVAHSSKYVLGFSVSGANARRAEALQRGSFGGCPRAEETRQAFFGR